MLSRNYKLQQKQDETNGQATGRPRNTARSATARRRTTGPWMSSKKLLINIFRISSWISEKVYICRLIEANRKEPQTASVSACYGQGMVYGNAQKKYKKLTNQLKNVWINRKKNWYD